MIWEFSRKSIPYDVAKKIVEFFFYGRRCRNIGRGPNWVDVGLMEKIFSAAEPQVGFAKPLPQTKPTRPYQSQMLGARFSFGFFIFSEDGKKGLGGNERGRVKVGDSQKKFTDLAL